MDPGLDPFADGQTEHAEDELGSSGAVRAVAHDDG